LDGVFPKSIARNAIVARQETPNSNTRFSDSAMRRPSGRPSPLTPLADAGDAETPRESAAARRIRCRVRPA
jgi:hypothetical protein